MVIKFGLKLDVFKDHSKMVVRGKFRNDYVEFCAVAPWYKVDNDLKNSIGFNE